MTKQQEVSLNKLRERFLGFYGHPEKHEIKNEELTENWAESNMVYVNLEVGYIGDEGTMAAVTCRSNLHVAIGKNGGYYAFRKSGKMFSCSSLTTAVIKGQDK
jgi:hypothetical protein